MQSEYRVAIVVLPNFTLLALSCIVDTLRLANRALRHEAYRCAAHWNNLPTFSAMFPLVEVRPEIYVHDRRRIMTACAWNVHEWSWG